MATTQVLGGERVGVHVALLACGSTPRECARAYVPCPAVFQHQ